MKFNTLYKTNANWKNGRQPKNHLSKEGDFVPFCSRRNVEWMGGTLEYTDGKWFGNGAVSDISIPEHEIRKTTCEYCFARVKLMVNRHL